MRIKVIIPIENDTFNETAGWHIALLERNRMFK